MPSKACPKLSGRDWRPAFLRRLPDPALPVRTRLELCAETAEPVRSPVLFAETASPVPARFVFFAGSLYSVSAMVFFLYYYFTEDGIVQYQ
jgi:hypothetical protein